MPLLTAQNRDTALLTNIVQTLAQIKDSTVQNENLVIPHAAGEPYDTFNWNELDANQWYNFQSSQWNDAVATATDCEVFFFADQAKTELVFTDSTSINPSSFTLNPTNTLYCPPDAYINDAADLSTTLCQTLYWVMVQFSDGTTVNTTYRNADNLLFQDVIVDSKPSPSYLPNENTAVIVVGSQKIDNDRGNSDRAILLPVYDVYVYLNVHNWSGLSALQRITAYQNTSNLVRNALHIDPFRGGNSMIYDKQIYGTGVTEIKPLPCPNQMQGVFTVRCAFYVEPTGY